MTAKEALENVKHEIQQRLNDMVVDGCDLGSVLAIESFIRSNLEVIEKALTELDRLQKFKATFDAYELSKKQDFIAYENWQECEKELEELKRDVKRYFELDNKHGCTLREIDEWLNLERKLMKVGKEE